MNSFASNAFGGGGGGLPTTGGTLTGVLTVPAGSAGAPSINFGDATTGLYRQAANSIGFSCNGTLRWYMNQDGTLYNAGANIIMSSGYSVMPALYLRSNGLCLLMGASDDLRMVRAAAGTLQLGEDHATTATPQTIKAHDVAGGAGASLTIKAGGGGADGSLYLASSASELAGFHGMACDQATNGIGAASITPNSSGIADDSATWGGYTVGQIVSALQEKGILA